MNNFLRILMITPFFTPNIGGVETHLDSLCKCLRKKNHKISVITYQPLITQTKAPKFEKKHNLEIKRINHFGYNLFNKLEPYPLFEFLYLTPILMLHSILFVLRNQKNIDIIHVHGLNAAFIAKVLGILFSKRIVVSIHAIYGLHKRPLLAKLFRWILSSSNIVLVGSRKNREDILATGLPKDKVKVFLHWVDQDLFKPLDKVSCKKELELENKFVVLFVGRFIEKKGVSLLVEVASKIDLDNVVFVFIGDGPLGYELQKKCVKQENVMFIGKVTVEDAVKYYNAANLVVVPSLYEESLGRVVLEALSCGVPVIASNVGGIPEVLNPSVGAFFKPNVEEISQTIKYFYSNPSELYSLTKNCRKYATTHFSDTNAKIIENSYQLSC